MSRGYGHGSLSLFFRLLKARKAAVTGAWLLLLGCIAVSISASQDSLHLGRLDGYQPDSLKGLLYAVQTVFRGQGGEGKGEGEGEGEGGSARGSAGGLVRASQQSFTGITLLDWGQKEINFPIDREHLLHLWYGYRPRGDYSTRAFFEFMGFNYTAIGHNEEYSANVLDGGEYIAPQIGLNSYDVIVNIGYSAYVGRRSGDYGDNDDFLMRQYIYFRNLHEVGKKGSVYYHMVPFKGSEWFQYGVTRYTLEFFKVLVGKSGYEVIALEIVDIDVPMTSISKPISCRCLRVSYRKSLETAFMPFEEFKDIKGLYDMSEEYNLSFDWPIRKYSITLHPEKVKELVFYDVPQFVCENYEQYGNSGSRVDRLHCSRLGLFRGCDFLSWGYYIQQCNYHMQQGLMNILDTKGLAVGAWRDQRGTNPLERTPTVLVIVYGNHRGGDSVWSSAKENLLDALNADMAILGPSERKTRLHSYAKYIWPVEDPADWGDYFDILDPTEAWRALCAIASNSRDGFGDYSHQFLGGVAQCHKGSAGILLAYREMARRKLIELELVEKYDWFIFTRSDYFWLCKHPQLSTFKQNSVYIPFGQEHGGLTDRFSVMPRMRVLEALNITNDLIINNWGLILEQGGSMDLNLEKLLLFYFELRNISVKKYFPTAFTVFHREDVINSYNGLWTAHVLNEVANSWGLSLKYPGELMMAQQTCEVIWEPHPLQPSPMYDER